MKKRVIFVGVHNKPGKEPLDSSTVSGKRIDNIIKNLEGCECIKTNLYNISRQPGSLKEKDSLRWEWLSKNPTGKNDIIVLLGSQVKSQFPRGACLGRFIGLAHPSLQYSKVSPTDYINNAVTLIHSLNHTFLTTK